MMKELFGTKTQKSQKWSFGVGHRRKTKIIHLLHLLLERLAFLEKGFVLFLAPCSAAPGPFLSHLEARKATQQDKKRLKST